MTLAAPESPVVLSRSSHCLVCQGGRVTPFLDLGETALANKFLSPAELSAPEPTYPLRVGFCADCGHVQLTVLVPPAAMFEDYLYVSSASDTLRAHFAELSSTLISRHRLGGADLVIDIGCNDGALLQTFASQGVRTLGVDPAVNLAELTRGKGIERYTGFFGAASAADIVASHGRASLVTATNTFPHIPDLQDFVRGVDTVLAPGGVFVLEAHYLLDMLEQRAFDTIYHEHVSYWALGPMRQLFERAGMEIVNAERLPIHHGQLRVSVQRRGEGRVRPEVRRILELEREHRLDRLDTYQQFAGEVLGVKRDLKRTLGELLAQGKRIAGYGAPAKGNTLLAFLEIGPETLLYIADRSSLKQGRYTPGQHIPVVPPERLLIDQPDFVLLLAWNFHEEIVAQQAAYRDRGGRFIIPVPQVRIV